MILNAHRPPPSLSQLDLCPLRSHRRDGRSSPHRLQAMRSASRADRFSRPVLATSHPQRGATGSAVVRGIQSQVLRRQRRPARRRGSQFQARRRGAGFARPPGEDEVTRDGVDTAHSLKEQKMNFRPSLLFIIISAWIIDIYLFQVCTVALLLTSYLLVARCNVLAGSDLFRSLPCPSLLGLFQVVTVWSLYTGSM